ncbi:OmpA family protein [Endozoicomonas sp. ONNA1]|uniref:OmpA/MotB family protein n=1 Tax=Endozoicomonas sp. ONNA1 TaxID=2828740 RepID=UPI0021494DB2|nr:OmpA family protein [Endozoicomonas sp. ONNA1]
MAIGSGVRRGKSRQVDEENPYWISFSDIMSGLLVIFILASLQLILELSETSKEVDQAITELVKSNQIRSQMLEEIRQDLLEQGIHVEVAENQSVLRIPDEQLYFQTLRHDIPADRTFAVNAIGAALYEAVMKDNRSSYIDTVFVEGHTDSRPAHSLKMGNWGLSAYRAITVWSHWRNNENFGSELSALKNRDGNPMFSVSGYAATRRKIEVDNTAEKQRQNRRIDVRFTMRQPSLIELKDIKRILSDSDV